MEDLDDTEIARLLHAAEVRLTGVDVLTHLVETETNSARPIIPKLEIGSITQPYISSDGGVAHADRHRLLVKEGIPVVEGMKALPDLQRKKDRVSKVAFSCSIAQLVHDRDKHQSLKQTPELILSSLCVAERSNHSYSETTGNQLPNFCAD